VIEMMRKDATAEQNSNNRRYGLHRTRKICFRLSDDEYRQVMGELEVTGQSLSALARARILGVRVAARADLAVLAELRRLGGLFKHSFTETGGVYSELTAQAIRDISAYARRLTEERGSPAR
jgi:hypothetical protein